jgi:hypothetical protein
VPANAPTREHGRESASTSTWDKQRGPDALTGDVDVNGDVNGDGDGDVNGHLPP